MKNMNLNELAKKAYENAKAKGFHDEKHTDGHYLMLVMCELAEAVEADRCGKRADRKEFERLAGTCEDVVWPHLFEMYIKDSVEDELADAVIRLLDYIGMKGFEIPDDYVTKENLTRTLDSTFRTEEWANLQTFAERVFISCCNNLLRMGDDYPDSVVYSVFAMAELYEIDLIWFIEQKMKYNERREVLHGKAY
jgi:hypothetical protein